MLESFIVAVFLVAFVLFFVCTVPCAKHSEPDDDRVESIRRLEYLDRTNEEQFRQYISKNNPLISSDQYKGRKI